VSEHGYRPEIDGLRTVAILPVLIFHMGYDWLPGGYLGVDVFFVISGYLITTILLREMESGLFSFRQFWARRIRRILPALIAVCLATLLAAWGIAFPTDRIAIGRQATATLLSVANIYFWRQAGDYWGAEAENSPFLHAWSLAVEEQFYLLFPLLLYAMIRWAPKQIALGLVVVIGVSLSLFFYGINSRPAAAFYLLPARAWELTTGALLAFRLYNNSFGLVPSSLTGPVALLGLSTIVVSYFLVPAFSVWAIGPVVGTSLVIACGKQGFVGALLGNRWAAGIGRVSYSLYLWHWPVIVLGRYITPQPPGLLLVAFFVAAALASYFLIESPLRRRPRTIPAISFAFACCLGLAVASTISGQKTFDFSQFDTLPEYSTAYDLHPRPEPLDTWGTNHPNAIAQAPLAPPAAYRDEGLVVRAGEGPPRVVVLGDSHGLMWAHAIRLACEEMSIQVAFYCIAGVSPFIDFPPSRHQFTPVLTAEEKYEFDVARIAHIERWKPALVFVCARWSKVKPHTADPLLAFLQQHAKHTVLIEQPPELMFAVRNGVAALAAFKGVLPREGVKQFLPEGNKRAYEAGRAVMSFSASRYRTCMVMPTRDLYANGHEVCFLDGRSLLYLDDNHQTTKGTLFALPRIRELIAALVEDNAYPAPPAVAPSALQSARQ
jgi:peptidoglycan/LPS O-acetylase OafA/YrhL